MRKARAFIKLGAGFNESGRFSGQQNSTISLFEIYQHLQALSQHILNVFYEFKVRYFLANHVLFFK